MDSYVEQIAEIGARSPLPVLPMDELFDRLEAALPGPPPHRKLLRSRIRTRPDLFRVLDPWRGPLRRLTRHETRGPVALDPEAVPPLGLPRRPWVVCLLWKCDPEAEKPLSTLRDSVAGMARETDEESFLALVRLGQILREEEEVRSRIGRTTGSRG